MESLQHTDLQQRLASWQDEVPVMNRIHDVISWHVAPVAMLGHRRTNLPAKFRTFIHVFALLSKDRKSMSKLLQSVVSVHTDYGTEVGLTRLGPACFDDVLPYIHAGPAPQIQDADPDDAFADDLALESVDNPEYFAEVPLCPDDYANLEASLEGPDLMHIIHNCTKGLSGVMQHYDGFVEGLKVVAKLLSERETKQQVRATCFSSVPGIAWKAEISGFHGKVHEERWGTIAHAVLRLSNLRPALRTCWDLQKFTFDAPTNQRPEHEQAEYGHRLQLFNECVNSDVWWGVMHVLHEIAVLQSDVSDWVNSCPCHYHVLKEGHLAADVFQAWSRCPLRGRRAAEVAAGDFFSLLSDLFNQASTRIEAGLPIGLSDEQVLSIMRDFEAARAHIMSTYVLKLSFWSQPPYVLAALGHYDPLARANAVERCLSSTSKHPLIQELRTHSDLCWAFLEGGALWESSADLGVLVDLAVRMRLMWTSAWRVEGQHARTKKAMTQAPHQSAAYVSMAHRLPEIKDLLKRRPGLLEDLADHVAKVKNGAQAAMLLGFQPNRAIDCGWLDPEAGQKNYKLIYHDDAYSKYKMSLPSSLKLRVVHEARLKDLVAASELALEG